ncbi:MAG: DUF362 domain-containing protein [Candidatus Lokiarchaeota archaeon]|nr:DUF362 domain-containing protein [Candidatus Lokiarchaeota archaeon]
MDGKTPIAITRIIDDDVGKAVREALDLVDAKRLMREGMLVLLKPNLLSAKPPERAVTTHPEVLRAVIRWAKQFKPRRIVVADSSAGTAMGTTEKVLKASLIEQTCQEEGVECMPLEKTTRTVYKVKDPLVLDEFAASTLLEEADLIVNLPKIKTHDLTRLTCCVKNMFGTLPLGNKTRVHGRFPLINDFCAALADVYSVSRPALAVVDGYLCQEGPGPSAGDVVKLDLILAGFDGVALDAAVCKIIGLETGKVPYLKLGEKKGLGTTDLGAVDFKGEPIESVMRPFKIPPGSPIAGVPMPRFLARYLANVVFKAAITFDPARCKLCATCWKNCPVGAITPPAELKQGNVPSWDKKKCITCYTCAETCPHEAVGFKIEPLKNAARSPLGIAAIAALGAIVLLAIWLAVAWPCA